MSCSEIPNSSLSVENYKKVHKMHTKCLHYIYNFAIIKTVKRGTLTIRGHNDETNYNQSLYWKQ
nr:MAG TPA: hypothetical protein [Caudoviricetes sp.]